MNQHMQRLPAPDAHATPPPRSEWDRDRLIRVWAKVIGGLIFATAIGCCVLYLFLYWALSTSEWG